MMQPTGKGERSSSKKSHVPNQNSQIISTMTIKEEIECAIIKHNRECCIRAHNARIYQDRICNYLQTDSIKDKIIDRILEREDYNNKKTCEFL